jgi:chromate transporter
LITCRNVRRAPLSVLVREWGRIGVTSFGGPPAQVALLRELCVERRRWIDAGEFEDANAATQLLPGPGGTQLAIYCAKRVGGDAGALLGGLAFILPGLVLVLAIAAVALSESPPLWIRAVGAGAAASVVAVVAEAGLALARTSLAGRPWRAVGYVLGGAAAAVLAGPGVVLVIVAAGLLELAWRRGAAVVAWPVGLVIAVATVPSLAWTALKVGVLSYGGGFVIIPLMRADAVDAHGWMSATAFANAVAYGQLTPGPVTHTVAIVGWAAAGFGGALLAAAIAFTPSFLMVWLLGDRFLRLRESRAARGFLDGAGPAAVGAILGAAVTLFDALEEPWQFVVLAGAAAALVLRVGPFWVLAGGAAAGLAAAAVGAAVP